MLGTSPVNGGGTTQAMLTVPAVVTNLHARLVTPLGVCDDTNQRRLYVCNGSLDEDFNASPNPNTWTTNGSAYWDSQGWLEMTGTVQNQKGSIFNPLYVIGAGSTSISFRIFTGGGSVPGADGFAVTVIESQAVDLQMWVQSALSGGGLGYGVGGPYGSFNGSAFTVEIDTWYNTFNGTNSLHTDPVNGDHLEITLGADPSNSLANVALPNVQDQQWHDIEVDIIGTRVRVRYDGQVALDVAEPSFQFKGGRLFFSGSTGFYTNLHRFDDLRIRDKCL